jgi:hypothetical protein
MTKGKVVLVPFPFDDLSASKVRPAVCLSDPIGPHKHVILAFITSRLPIELLRTNAAIVLIIEGVTNLPRLPVLIASRAPALLNFSELSRTLAMPQSTLKRHMTHSILHVIIK